jgi:hypothetical protein
MLAPQANPSADSFEDIREAVRALCAQFPGVLARARPERGYPTEFVSRAGVDSKTKTDEDDGSHTKDLQKVARN